ncbi:MFS transporter [Candidatus Woesearchaeota archaeon]|nr:MFS transporter [Candidatus Woesearchaeota archaeon]
MQFTRKLSAHHMQPKGKLFAWLALTVGLGNAAFWTIFPLIIDDTIKSETLVGIFFTAIALIGLVVTFLSPIVLKRVSRIYLTQLSLLAIIGLLFLFTFANQILHFYFIESLRSIFALFVGLVLALFVRDFATERELGAAEGRYYLYANVGWFVGPLIGGFLGDYVSRNSVFLFSAFMYLITFIIFQYNYRTQHEFLEHVVEKDSFTGIVKKNLFDFFKAPEMWKVFMVGTGLSFWWVIHEIYFPIYISLLGYSDKVVGIVLAGGIVPLILFEKFVGNLADKHGMRPFLALGFLLLGCITIVFSVTPVISVVLFLMAVVNVGSAFIEPLQDAYLFKAAKRKDEDRFYGIFKMSYPIANVVAPLIAAGLIFIGGFNGLWYGTAVIMFIFAAISFTAKR